MQIAVLAQAFMNLFLIKSQRFIWLENIPSISVSLSLWREINRNSLTNSQLKEQSQCQILITDPVELLWQFRVQLLVKVPKVTTKNTHHTHTLGA